MTGWQMPPDIAQRLREIVKDKTLSPEERIRQIDALTDVAAKRNHDAIVPRHLLRAQFMPKSDKGLR